jgi:hypothetical protein
LAGVAVAVVAAIDATGVVLRPEMGVVVTVPLFGRFMEVVLGIALI